MSYTKGQWNWEVIDGAVYITCHGKKIAKMLSDDVGKEEMIDNTSLIKVMVNVHQELEKSL